MFGSFMEDLKTYNIEIVVASGGFCIVRIIVHVDLCFLKFSPLEGYSKFHKTLDSNFSLQIVKYVLTCLYVHKFHVSESPGVHVMYNVYTTLCTGCTNPTCCTLLPHSAHSPNDIVILQETKAVA